uniref:Uncharacterized protein AlNc14C61G4474 n=1 Tax=Albugo laibachii Nc14 TaxID=890382 RepID=F0WCU8_9STRA|nr:hypothetical protein PITG_04079 [Albugo laibachii Nc14]|eukprot:CCA19017.1 hypothetical protein PITG_04079 [Albugo laibachii Nc14]
MHWWLLNRSTAFHSAFRVAVSVPRTITRSIRSFPTRILVRNQAFLNKCRTKVYNVQKEWSLGIQLLPSEVKSLREHTGDLSNSFATFYKNELFLHECNIPIWRHGLIGRPEPLRPRKLLARRSELKKLQGFTKDTRAELIPTCVQVGETGWIKVIVAECKKVGQFDHRQRDRDRDIKRELRDF